MTECLEEQTTQHFRGHWHGFGPVRNHEKVIFAVFEATSCNGRQLIAASFDNDHLKSITQSLARHSFVTLPTFYRTIVRSADSVLRGVAIANVAAVRALVADIKLNAGQVTVRAFCLLDRVEEGDCDGHATVGYSETHETFNISQGQLGKVRARIRLDLANTFSEINDVVACRWPRIGDILLGRTFSIGRTLSSILSDWGATRLQRQRI
jgi:hypothetical protein